MRGLFRAIVLVACIAASGCAGRYSRLVPENSLADLRDAKRATIDGGNHTVTVNTSGADGQKVRIAVHQLDGPVKDRVLVMIHGVMADHTTWRFVAGNLARDHAVWLVDLPGCGQSDAAPNVVPETYTCHDQSERTLEALRECLKTYPPGAKLALVGHSYGGTMIIDMFGNTALRDKYADVLERVDRLVLICPFDVAMSNPATVFREVAEASSLRIRMASATGALKDRVAAATIASVPDPKRALKEEADKRIEFLEDSAKRRALQETLKKACWWTADLRPDWDRIEPVEAAYSKVDRECLVIVGMRDEAIPASMGFKMAAQLPRAVLVPMPRVMHSPHIEAHDKVSVLIRTFVTTGKIEGEGVRVRENVAGW